MAGAYDRRYVSFSGDGSNVDTVSLRGNINVPDTTSASDDR